MHVVVTGGAGNVGSAVCERLVRMPDVRVTVIDDLSTGDIKNLPHSPRLHFLQCDVNESGDIQDRLAVASIDIVFHFAAVVGVERTLANPFAVFRDIQGIENVAKLALRGKARRVIYSSSSEVYGEPVDVPSCEDATPVNPRLPYAIVKAFGEAYFKACRTEHGLDYTILRMFNTYGPKQTDDFVIPRFVQLALRDRPLPIYGDGQQTRTFCYVDDSVEACLSIMSNSAFANQIVNVGSDREIAILDLARLIVALAGSTSTIELRPALTPEDARRRRPRNERMRALLARDLVSLETGISRMIEHHRGLVGNAG